MRHLIFKFRFIGLITLALVGGMWPVGALAAGGGFTATAQAASNPSLGSADGFAVLAGTAATCTTSTIAGNVGVNFNPPTTAGCNAQYAPSAYMAFRRAFTEQKPACVDTLLSTFPNATTNLGPSTYCTGAGFTATNQTLNLTGTGSWFFEIGAGFTTTNLNVVMADGGNPCNVFWWIAADATLTVNSAVSAPFQGTILGGGAITLTGNAGTPAALTLTGHVWATTAFTMTNATIVGCTGGGTVVCRNGAGDDVDEDAGQSGESAHKDGGNAKCKPAKQHCNQGVGNGPEGCDPGNSNQGDESRSNDELGGTPGNPGRKGGNGKNGAETASISNSHESAKVATKSDSHINKTAAVAVAAKGESHNNNTAAVAVAAKSESHPSSNHDVAAKSKSDSHANGKSKSKDK